MTNRLSRLALIAVVCSGVAVAATPQKTAPAEITADSFKCIRDMTPVRGFYVANLNGNLKGTLAAANTTTGAVYPPGSVVQPVPTEVMVKREPGFNAATKIGSSSNSTSRTASRRFARAVSSTSSTGSTATVSPVTSKRVPSSI